VYCPAINATYGNVTWHKIGLNWPILPSNCLHK